MSDSDKLLREFVITLLREESFDSMKKTFVDPFTDVGATAQAGIDVATANMKSTAKIFLKRITPRMFQMINQSYEDIFRDARNQAEEVKRRNAKVFQGTDIALQGDAGVFAFLLDPTTYLGAKGVQVVDRHALKGMRESAIDILDTAYRKFLAAGDRLSRPTSTSSLERQMKNDIERILKRRGYELSPDESAQASTLLMKTARKLHNKQMKAKILNSLRELGIEDDEYAEKVKKIVDQLEHSK